MVNGQNAVYLSNSPDDRQTDVGNEVMASLGWVPAGVTVGQLSNGRSIVDLAPSSFESRS